MGVDPLGSPGRYFAAKELKAILAHIILNYDMKLGGDGSRPPNVYFAMGVMPAVSALWALALTSSSLSEWYIRRSEWPTTT